MHKIGGVDNLVCWKMWRIDTYSSDAVASKRTLKLNREVRLSYQEWKETLLYFEGACAYCGATPRKNQRLTKDHLLPISAGGKTIQSNIVPACSSCNGSKGSMDFKDWFMTQPFFSQNRLNKIFKWRTIMRQVEANNGHR